MVTKTIRAGLQAVAIAATAASSFRPSSISLSLRFSLSLVLRNAERSWLYMGERIANGVRVFPGLMPLAVAFRSLQQHEIIDTHLYDVLIKKKAALIDKKK